MDLNDEMEFDRVIVIDDVGQITDSELYAPECFDNGTAGIDFGGSKGWEAMNGYSGQYGYAGPIMHASEYVGGGLADDIMSTPGTYVVVVVTDLDDIDGEPSGWAVLRRTDDVA